MTHFQRTYLPAAGKHWRLPLYDTLANLLGASRARRLLARHVSCKPGTRILEVGCGTGELILLLKRAHPDGVFIGLDPDANALERANRKARRAGVSVRFDQGFAEAMPYPDAHFDRAVSSFVFHHLTLESKRRMLREVRRVLRPGAPFDMLDLAGPSPDGRGFPAQRVFLAHLKDNDEERVLELMSDAGLVQLTIESRLSTCLIEVVCYGARAPERHSGTAREGSTVHR